MKSGVEKKDSCPVITHTQKSILVIFPEKKPQKLIVISVILHT